MYYLDSHDVIVLEVAGQLDLSVRSEPNRNLVALIALQQLIVPLQHYSVYRNLVLILSALVTSLHD